MVDDGQDISEIVRRLLPDWLIFDIQKMAPDCYLVTAQYSLPVKFCYACGIINPRLIRYGRKEVSRQLRVTWISVRTIRQRFKCKECGRTFWEPLPPLEGLANTKLVCDFEFVF